MTLRFGNCCRKHTNPCLASGHWGSLCSRSEGARFVSTACEESIGTWNTASGQVPLQSEQLFACESVGPKGARCVNKTKNENSKHIQHRETRKLQQQQQQQSNDTTDNTNKNGTRTDIEQKQNRGRGGSKGNGFIISLMYRAVLKLKVDTLGWTF